MTTLITPANFPEAKRELITAFYAASDRRDVDKYLSFFTENVDFIMGLKPLHGLAAVRALREVMWTGVATRKHTPRNLYVRDDNGNDLMLIGELLYGLENGKRVSIDFAARIVFAEGDDAMKIQRYQVWLDASRLATALKE